MMMMMMMLDDSRENEFMKYVKTLHGNSFVAL